MKLVFFKIIKIIQWRIQDFPGGANLLFGITFAKNCMKMENEGELKEGGHASLEP